MYKEITENAKTVTKQGFISFGENIVEFFLKYIYAILLARLLQPALVGVYFMGFTIINFVMLASRLELQEGVLRFVASALKGNDRARAKGFLLSAIKIGSVCGLAALVVMLALAQYISAVYRQPLLKNVLILFAVSLPFMAVLTILLSLFQATLRMKYYAFIKGLVQPIFNIALFVVVFMLGFGLGGAVFAYTLSVIMALAVLLVIAKKKYTLFNADIKAQGQGKELLRFTLPITLSVLLHFVIQWSDTVILGYYRDMTEVGMYSIALRTAALVVILYVPVSVVFAPMAAELFAKKELSKLQSLFNLVTKWVAISTAPVLLIFILMPEEVLKLFGHSFVRGSPALILLSLGQMFTIIAGPVYYVILMAGRSRIVFVNAAFICIANLAANFLLIPRYGLFGAAASNAITLFLFNVVMLLESRALFNVYPVWTGFKKPVLAALLSASVFLILKAGLRIGAPMYLGFIMVFVYIGTLFLLRFDRHDRDLFRILKNETAKYV